MNALGGWLLMWGNIHGTRKCMTTAVARSIQKQLEEGKGEVERGVVEIYSVQRQIERW